VCEKATQAVDLAGKGLSEQDRQIFYSVLHRIATNLQAIAAEGLPELHKA